MRSGAGEWGGLRGAGAEQPVLKAVVATDENGASGCGGVGAAPLLYGEVDV